MITVRPYTPDDYATATAWWKAHGQSQTPEQFLPKMGVVALSGFDVPLAMAWFIMSNSHGVVYMEWLVANPDFKHYTKEAVRELIAAASKTLRDLNYSVMFASSSDSRMISAAYQLGFTPLSTNMTHLVKTI